MARSLQFNKVALVILGLCAGFLNFVLPFMCVPIFSFVLIILYLDRSRMLYVVGGIALVSFFITGIDTINIISLLIVAGSFAGAVFITKTKSPQFNTMCVCVGLVVLASLPLVAGIVITSSNVQDYSVGYIEANYNDARITNTAKLYYTFFTPDDDYEKLDSSSSEYNEQVKQQFLKMFTDVAGEDLLFIVTGLAVFSFLTGLCLAYFLYPLMFGEYKRKIEFDKITFTKLTLGRKFLLYGLLPALAVMVLGSMYTAIMPVTVSLTNSLLILPTCVYGLSFFAFAFSYCKNKILKRVLYGLVAIIGLCVVVFPVLQTLLSLLSLAVCILNAKKWLNFALT